MSQYTHRMTLAVPESLIPQANQLALIVGESADDVNTFTKASYQDAEGNKYAACSTVIKPIVLSLLDTPLTDSPLQAEGADVEQAQAALDKVVVYSGSEKASADNIMCAINYDPLEFFASIGMFLTNTDEGL